MYIRFHTVRGHKEQAYTYLELVYSERRDGKVQQERVCSLGRLEDLQNSGALDRMMAKLAEVTKQRWVRAEALQLGTPWAKEYGLVLLVRRLWEDLGLERVINGLRRQSAIEVSVSEALLAMVVNRLVMPGSECDTYHWLQNQVYAPEWQGLELHHLYRSLDFLDKHMSIIEEQLFFRLRDLFSLELKLVLFDTTSSYFEGRGPAGLAATGYSRDKRPDRVQVVIAVLMTHDGMPVAHYVFPGNTADINAFRLALKDLKGRFPLGGRVVVVADRGVVAEPLLQALEGEKQEYIVGIPLHKWKAAGKVLRRPGRFHVVAENLRVKEVQLDGKRYIVCHNPEREPEDARRRAEIVAALEKELAQGDLAKLAKKKGYGRYVNIEEKGKAGINWWRVERDARYDGKYLLRTATELSPAEVATAYKDLWRIEAAFRDLKSGLEIRPMYHWTPPRVRGHIAVCFLALVIESALARLLRDHGCHESTSKVIEALQQVRAVRVELEGQVFLTRTDLPALAQKAFTAVGLRPPSKVQSLSA
jgi:transposase